VVTIPDRRPRSPSATLPVSSSLDHQTVHFTVLAGREYAAVFTTWGHHFLKACTWSLPLEGLGIEQQDSWLLRQQHRSQVS